MKSIFYKDCLYNKTLIYWWIFLTIGFSLLYVPQGDFTTEILLSFIFVNNFILNSLTENFTSGWYSFLLATPTKRNKMVNSIFLEVLFLILLTISFSSIVSIITALILKISLTKLFNKTSLIIILLFISYDLTLLSFDIFVSFKYGVKIARTISIIIILITLVIFIGLANFLENLIFIYNPLNSLLVLLFGLFIIGFFVFYYLTIQTVKKKDF